MPRGVRSARGRMIRLVVRFDLGSLTLGVLSFPSHVLPHPAFRSGTAIIEELAVRTQETKYPGVAKLADMSAPMR